MRIMNLVNPEDALEGELSDIEANVVELRTEQSATTMELDQLRQRIEALSREMNLVLPEGDVLHQHVIDSLDEVLTQQILDAKSDWTEDDFRKLPPMTGVDMAVCGVIGMISILVDVLLVGTPDFYRQSADKSGSVLTAILRNIGTGDDGISTVLKWFSDKCKVPYDISCATAVVNPNNHRLRSLGHDPFLGLLFAVVDIILGTTTCVNSAGALTVMLNPKPVPTSEKILSVFYYFGHIISDMCTTRGIPIPGFFLTQFFTGENTGGSSIAKTAENMYLNGYDLRHLLSMQTSVWLKDILLDYYLTLSAPPSTVIAPIAQQEREALAVKLRREKLFLATNTLATTGNLVKFLAPPNHGNPCALNLPQWVAFIKSGLAVTAAVTRDTTAERIMHNREIINKHWDELQLK